MIRTNTTKTTTNTPQKPQVQMLNLSRFSSEGLLLRFLKVGDLYADVLRDYFGQYGELAECRLVVDKHSSKSRGFGFVAFHDPDSSQAVLDQKHFLLGKEVECKAALSKHDSNQRVSDEKSKKIFVGGIPLYVTEGRTFSPR